MSSKSGSNSSFYLSFIGCGVSALALGFTVKAFYKEEKRVKREIARVWEEQVLGVSQTIEELTEHA